MYNESCRIFVLEKEKIENIIKNCRFNKVFIETFFHEYGAYIKVSSKEKKNISDFLSDLNKHAGSFYLKNSLIDDYNSRAEDIAGFLLGKAEKTVVTSESCTGGLIAKKLTDRAGSSAYFWGSFVTYDNSAKAVLGVNRDTLETSGAVSSKTVCEMAEAAFSKSGADISVSVSGIAGPGGGSREKPVGTVWFGYKTAKKEGQIKMLFKGSRQDIREKASETALLLIIKSILYDAGVDSIISADYI